MLSANTFYLDLSKTLLFATELNPCFSHLPSESNLFFFFKYADDVYVAQMTECL